MSYRQSLVLFVAVMVAVFVGAGGLAIFRLYDTALEQHRLLLIDMVQLQARQIDAIGRFNLERTHDARQAAVDTLSTLRDAHARPEGLGHTAELVLGTRRGDDILFLLPSAHYDLDNPRPVPFAHEWAEPMRRALGGESGTVIALDYRGELTLAAYEPAGALGLGKVVKTDLASIRGRYLEAAAYGGLVALLAVLLSTVVFIRMTHPLFRHLEESDRALRELHAITSSQDKQFDEQLDALLAMGCTRFGLPIGILSRIVDDRYFVEAVVDHRGVIVAGSEFELGKTYCSETVKRREPLHFEDVDGSKLAGHPGHDEAGFRAYIATPVWVGEQLYGTLSFSGPDPRAEPFTGTDDEILKIMAQWVGGEIWRRRTHEALRQTERQMHQAQKMEAVGTLASGIAHDFNNLLMGLIGCADVALKRLGPDDGARGPVKEVKRAAFEGATLVRELLTFSRRQEAEPVVVDVDETLARRENIFRSVLGAQVRLSIERAGEPLPVRIVAGQLEQVLMNLVINASHAMDGAGDLGIAVRAVELTAEDAARLGRVEPGRYARIEVRDTGSGMDEETRQRIFEPFFSTKSIDKGTGLGLASVWGIVTQSSGHVDVESRPGEGATFTVHLPLSEASTWKSPQASRVSVVGGGEAVLVVEDDLFVRRTVVGYLADAGYRVIEGKGTDDALARFAAEDDVALVLTDIVLPERSGVELAKELRTSRPAPAVLFMSAFSTELLEERGLLEPGAEVLQKPFTAAALIAKVRDALQRGEARPSPDRATRA